ncbi:hypothetical protein U2F25_34655 [Micromonospora sp. 4G53]|uniref:Uncharacterized protein n=1 Tax=Micromonospora sicca TaxID=2202420 RepID=A0ABU5JPG9_9ACTN|nr:hypothetical protein [Micromonospora sp. 4G53]
MPSLLRRIKNFKGFGVEAELSVAEVAVEVQSALNAAESSSVDVAPKRPRAELSFNDRPFWETRKSHFRLLLSLRFNLISVVEQVEAAYGLHPLLDPANPVLRLPARPETPGIRLDIAPEVVDASLRRLAETTRLPGWSNLADAVSAIHAFAEQAIDGDLAKRVTAVLAENAYGTCKRLATQSVSWPHEDLNAA